MGDEARSDRMVQVELPAGPVACADSGGDGPVVVLLHGLLMDARLWDDVVPGLPPDLRVVRPTLPLGAHRRPMRPGADLSLRGQARIVADLLEALDLRDVTLVFVDWCAAQVLVAEGWDDRVARLVLVACETDDNYPPGLPGRTAALAAAVPGGFLAAATALRLRPLRRLPMTFGWMSRRPVPDDVMDGWLRPAATRRGVRRDLRAYAGDTRAGRRVLAAATAALGGFRKPVLVVWPRQDRVMPPASGRRLAAAFPDARLVEVDDSASLVPVDQPQVLARLLADFVVDGLTPGAEPAR